MTSKAQRALQLIRKSNGKIFSCDFCKKDRSLRHMVARLGVRKGVTGKGLSFDPLERGLLPVYDMQKRAWRMVNLETVSAVRVNGVTHTLIL